MSTTSFNLDDRVRVNFPEDARDTTDPRESITGTIVEIWSEEESLHHVEVLVVYEDETDQYYEVDAVWCSRI